jgi:hypothetical protein
MAAGIGESRVTTKDHLRNLRGPMRARLERQTSRRLGVAKVLRETPDATNIELAKIFDVDRDTIAEDRKFLMSQAKQNAVCQFEIWRDEHIAELDKLRESLEDFLIPPEKRIELALAIIREDSKIKGTAAPTKSIVGHVNGPQLDALYLDIRQELLDADDATKQEALVMVRELVKSRRKETLNGIPQLSERNVTVQDGAETPSPDCRAD